MIKKDYRARIAVVGCIFSVLFVIVLVRLYLVQIHQQSFFDIIAKHQYQVSVKLEPPRALVYDRNRNLLAFNREASSAFVLPKQLDTKKSTIKFLKKYYPSVCKNIQKHPKRHFFWIERKLSKNRLAWLNKKASQYGVKDIQYVKEAQRFYPYDYCAQVLGFTDIDNNGIAGIEKKFCSQLRGKSSVFSLQKDARSKDLYFEHSIVKQGVQGVPVTLTIDKNLQYLAFEQVKKTVEKFSAESGAALIIDPNSGEILAMTQYPTFDPNVAKPTDLSVTKSEIVTQCYELGSVVKVFAALAALDEGVVTVDEEIDCEGKVAMVHGFKVENWKHLEVLPFYDVIRKSSNIGTAKVIHRVGDKFYDHLIQLGFGKKTGIEFIGERSGFVNHPNNWSRSSLTVLSFGYEIMASLLQLGKAISIIANGGYDCAPHLVYSKNRKYSGKRLYCEATMENMKTILQHSATPYKITGIKTMGKTGTARVVVDGKYSNKQHIFTFAGCVERDDYKRVIVTFIKKPAKTYLWASQVTAPLFKKITEKMLLYERD